MVELTPDQHDALQELVNIGVGRAAGVLNSMLETHISLRVPHLSIMTPDELSAELCREGGGTLSSVQLEFRGPFSGIAALVFPVDGAAKLVRVVADEDDPDEDFDSLRIGTLEEIGNIVINGVMGTFGNLVDGDLHYKVPNYMDTSCDQLAESWSEVSANFLSIDVSFDVASHAIRGTLQLLFELNEQHDPMVLLDRVVPSVR